jgi:hypothetical protein
MRLTLHIHASLSLGDVGQTVVLPDWGGWRCRHAQQISSSSKNLVRTYHFEVCYFSLRFSSHELTFFFLPQGTNWDIFYPGPVDGNTLKNGFLPRPTTTVLPPIRCLPWCPPKLSRVPEFIFGFIRFVFSLPSLLSNSYLLTLSLYL